MGPGWGREVRAGLLAGQPGRALQLRPLRNGAGDCAQLTRPPDGPSGSLPQGTVAPNGVRACACA
jgi:hypothetical protein